VDRVVSSSTDGIIDIDKFRIGCRPPRPERTVALTTEDPVVAERFGRSRSTP